MSESPLSRRVAGGSQDTGYSDVGELPPALAVATTPGRWSLAGKYRLTILFGITALLAIVAAGFLISHLIVHIAENNMIRISEKSLSTDMLGILKSIEDQRGESLTLDSVVNFNGLPMRLPALAADYSLVGLRVFDTQGRVVWSTNRQASAVVNHEDSLFQSSLQGETASRFLPNRELAELDGVRPQLAVVETYLPLRSNANQQVVGVLEIQRNVTEDVTYLIGSTRISVLRVTGTVMGGLFLALLSIVVLSDLAIGRLKRRERLVLREQLVERHQAAQALLHSNQQLENVVEKLKDTQQQILQQERLRALGQMASGITHDFNNALTPILGFSSMLVSYPELLDDRETLSRQLRFINTAAEDAAAVVARLKEFYRKREGVEEFTSLHLVEIADLAVSLTQAKWKSQTQAQGITINLETDFQEVPNVLGNASELREALINLVINAVDAMPSGGTLTLSTRREGDYAVLRVADTGTGMTESVRSRCLDPFFTTKGTHGTGMGLAMVYGIMQRHDGMLDIETALNRGTTFVLKLPVQREPLPEVQPVTDTAGPGRGLRVLVVDDEPLIRQLVGDFLRMDGHVAEVAESGTLGVERFAQGDFDLVLTDRAMPDMSGDQLAQVVKDRSPETPVILLTGFGDIMAVSNEQPAGVDLILGKPLTQPELRKAIERVMAVATFE